MAGGADPGLAGADVAFGQPDAAGAMQSARLRWIQLTSAGYTRYDAAAFRGALRGRGAALTNSSSVYSEPCAEHALAFILAGARQLPEAFANQFGARAWPQESIRAGSRLLTGQRAVFLGFGAIGRRLAQLLAPFPMDITVVRRHPAARGEAPGVKIVVNEEDPREKSGWVSAAFVRALQEADHVIDILPESGLTRNYFDARRFSMLKKGAVFYNIGRGATVDQEALTAALRSGQLAAAYLDVTEPEPLPPEHPLWSTPGCFITPHTAGGHHDEEERLVRHFLANLARFTGGAELQDRVM